MGREDELPWARLLTVYSAERNTTWDGKPRINLNHRDLKVLHAQLTEALERPWADFVVAYRQFGPTTKAAARRPPTSSPGTRVTRDRRRTPPDSRGPEAETPLDLTLPPKYDIECVLDLVGAAVALPSKPDEREGEEGVEGKGEAVSVLTCPLEDDPQAVRDQLPRLAGLTTTTDRAAIYGRVNVNEAPRCVLLGVPGLDAALVDRILSLRTTSADGSDPQRRDAVWLLTEGLVDRPGMTALWPYVTGGGDVFRDRLWPAGAEPDGPFASQPSWTPRRHRLGRFIGRTSCPLIHPMTGGHNPRPQQGGPGLSEECNHAADSGPRLGSTRDSLRARADERPEGARAGAGHACAELGRPSLCAGDEAWTAEIKGLVTHWQANRASVLVAVPRSAVELLYLTVPPATDEELPELVANLAAQQSPAISEQTLLDFLPAEGDPGAPRPVLVVALAEEEQQRIRSRLAAAGLTPQRIVLRPLAGASLFRRLISASDRTCLVIDRVGQDLELNVIAPGRLGFTRTVRLPEQASEEDVAGRLVAEAKRTVLAAPREHVGDAGIQSVYVFGRQAEYEPLAAEIGRELSLPVEVLDPLDAVEAPEAAVPPQPEHLAPLLGVLLDEAAGSHPIDLLHPRRPPHPWARRRVAALAVGGLALVALTLGLYVWGNLAEANADNERLAIRLRNLNETAKKAAKQKTGSRPLPLGKTAT